ncbi:hypothetical protein [Nostoc sp.]
MTSLGFPKERCAIANPTQLEEFFNCSLFLCLSDSDSPFFST